MSPAPLGQVGGWGAGQGDTVGMGEGRGGASPPTLPPGLLGHSSLCFQGQSQSYTYRVTPREAAGRTSLSGLGDRNLVTSLCVRPSGHHSELDAALLCLYPPSDLHRPGYVRKAWRERSHLKDDQSEAWGGDRNLSAVSLLLVRETEAPSGLPRPRTGDHSALPSAQRRPERGKSTRARAERPGRDLLSFNNFPSASFLAWRLGC